jgi:hypothetical protein
MDGLAERLRVIAVYCICDRDASAGCAAFEAGAGETSGADNNRRHICPFTVETICLTFLTASPCYCRKLGAYRLEAYLSDR